jgi:hypothetical protein
MGAMASPFPQESSLTRAQYEALRGPLPNGNGHRPDDHGAEVELSSDLETSDSGPEITPCSQCEKAAVANRPTCGSPECVRGHRSMMKRAAYGRQHNGTGPKPPAPSAIPVAANGSQANVGAGISPSCPNDRLLAFLIGLGPVQLRSAVIAVDGDEFRITRTTNGGT